MKGRTMETENGTIRAFADRKCKWCGKRFVPTAERGWKSRGKYFCRYSCMRAWERADDAKKDGRIGNPGGARKRPKYTPELLDECARLYVEEKIGYAEIRRRTGVAEWKVERVVRERGLWELRKNGGGNKRRDLDEEDIVQQYLDGATMQEIGEQYRASTDAVRRVLTERGVKIRPAIRRDLAGGMRKC